jgi:hypothetical protein
MPSSWPAWTAYSHGCVVAHGGSGYTTHFDLKKDVLRLSTHIIDTYRLGWAAHQYIWAYSSQPCMIRHCTSQVCARTSGCLLIYLHSFMLNPLPLLLPFLASHGLITYREWKRQDPNRKETNVF